MKDETRETRQSGEMEEIRQRREKGYRRGDGRNKTETGDRIQTGRLKKQDRNGRKDTDKTARDR